VVQPRCVLRSQVLGYGKYTGQTQLNFINITWHINIMFDLCIYHNLVLAVFMMFVFMTLTLFTNMCYDMNNNKNKDNLLPVVLNSKHTWPAA
jgi:hypothetical protein